MRRPRFIPALSSNSKHPRKRQASRHTLPAVGKSRPRNSKMLSGEVFEIVVGLQVVGGEVSAVDTGVVSFNNVRDTILRLHFTQSFPHYLVQRLSNLAKLATRFVQPSHKTAFRSKNVLPPPTSFKNTFLGCWRRRGRWCGVGLRRRGAWGGRVKLRFVPLSTVAVFTLVEPFSCKLETTPKSKVPRALGSDGAL